MTLTDSSDGSGILSGIRLTCLATRNHACGLKSSGWKGLQGKLKVKVESVKPQLKMQSKMIKNGQKDTKKLKSNHVLDSFLVTRISSVERVRLERKIKKFGGFGINI